MPRIWTEKPPYGTPIDWTTPLSQGIVAFFACNEGAGFPIDMAYGLQLSSVSGTRPTWGFGNEGAALVTNPGSSTQCGYYTPAPTYAQVSAAATIIWSGTLVTTSGGTNDDYAPCFGSLYDQTGGFPYYGIYLGLGAGALTLNYNYNGNNTRIGATIPSGWPRKYWLAGTFRSGSQAFYVDTPYAANATSSDVGVIQYGTLPWFGFNAHPDARNPHASHDYGIVYNRVLSTGEMAALQANPWQVFLPPDDGWLSVAAAGGTSTGAGAVTLGGFSVAGAGVFTAPGSGAVSLAGLVAAGTASSTSISGTTASGAITLSSLTVAGSGSFSTSAGGAVTLGAHSVSGAGAFSTSASGAVSLGALAVSGTGVLTASASGAVALGALSAAGSGSFTAPASGAITLGALTVAGSGAFSTSASGSIALAALGVSGSGTSSGVYTDTFADTAGTALTSHTPDAGGTWATLLGNAAVITAGNRARQSGTSINTAIHYHSYYPPSANYDVSADVTQLSATTDEAAGVAGRVDSATDSAYMARFSQIGTPAIQLFRRVSGAYSSVLASSAFSPTTGVAFRLTLRMTGNVISVLKDGVQVLTYTDTIAPISGVGRAGIALCATTVAPTDTTGVQVDNFLGFLSSTSTGSGGVTLAALSAAGAGAFTASASGGVTLGVLTVAGAGRFTASAAGSVTLAGLGVAGSGTASTPGVSTGGGSITLGVLSASAAGGFAAAGTGSIVLAGLGVDGSASGGGVALAFPAPAFGRWSREGPDASRGYWTEGDVLVE